jgi:hypothetical protein
MEKISHPYCYHATSLSTKHIATRTMAHVLSFLCTPGPESLHLKERIWSQSSIHSEGDVDFMAILHRYLWIWILSTRQAFIRVTPLDQKVIVTCSCD